MSKRTVALMAVIVVMGSILGILVVSGVFFWVDRHAETLDAKDAEIAQLDVRMNSWADKALKYQAERNGLHFENEDLKAEIAEWEVCAAKRNAEPNKSTPYGQELQRLHNRISELYDINYVLEAAASGPIVTTCETCELATEEPEPEPEPNEPEPNESTPFTDLVQESLKGVVHLQCPSWQGSGFVVGPRLIVTARHCVENVEDFLITTHDGHQVRASRAISDKEHDVAFIFIDDLTCVEGDSSHDRLTCKKTEHEVTLSPLPLGSIKDCVLGQSVYVIGSPYGKINFNALSVGVISGVNRDWNDIGRYDYGWSVAFTVDSAGHPGNSGCPVFTIDGVVRGILVGGFSPVLISVMPCDLFLGDLDSIRLMFLMDRFEREEVVEYQGWEGYGSKY